MSYYNNKMPILNGWKYFSVAMVLVALFLLYKTCNPPKLPVVPAVIPTSVQKETVKVDSIASKKYKDSVTALLKKSEGAAETWYNEWKASETRYADLEKGTMDLIDTPVPDTCNAMKAAFVKQFKALAASASKSNITCQKTIDEKNNIIYSKDLLIKKGQDDYRKLKVNFDTCISQQQKLSNAINKVKSKTELYAGIMAMGNEIKPFEGAGVSLGIRNKKGSQIEVFALQLNSGVHYGVSLKKVLFRF